MQETKTKGKKKSVTTPVATTATTTPAKITSPKKKQSPVKKDQPESGKKVSVGELLKC